MTEPVSILVLDDDAPNRSLIVAVLRRSPDVAIAEASIRQAASLAEARAALAAGPVDLLMLDVHLPDGLGLELAAELGRDPARPAILALTASVLPADQQAALDAGCDAFLAKPFPSADLLSASRALLADRRRGTDAPIR